MKRKLVATLLGVAVLAGGNVTASAHALTRSQPHRMPGHAVVHSLNTASSSCDQMMASGQHCYGTFTINPSGLDGAAASYNVGTLYAGDNGQFVDAEMWLGKPNATSWTEIGITTENNINQFGKAPYTETYLFSANDVNGAYTEVKLLQINTAAEFSGGAFTVTITKSGANWVDSIVYGGHTYTKTWSNPALVVGGYNLDAIWGSEDTAYANECSPATFTPLKYETGTTWHTGLRSTNVYPQVNAPQTATWSGTPGYAINVGIPCTA